MEVIALLHIHLALGHGLCVPLASTPISDRGQYIPNVVEGSWNSREGSCSFRVLPFTVSPPVVAEIKQTAQVFYFLCYESSHPNFFTSTSIFVFPTVIFSQTSFLPPVSLYATASAL